MRLASKAFRASMLTSVAVLLLSVRPVHPQAKGDSEVLTNESIVRMTQSGLGPALIIKMINDEPSDFRLGAANVIQLKQKGVPQSVISAMLSKKAPAAAASTAATSNAVPHQNAKPTAANYAWEQEDKTDPITRKQTFAVSMETPALSEDNGVRQGRFQVTATCNSADTTLQIAFMSDASPGIGFKQNTETYIVPGGLFGALAMASHHQKPWTITRIRVGDSEGKQVTSEDDYKNVADVYFTVPQPKGEAANQDEAGARALLQFASFLGPNKPAGETEELFHAKVVLLETELENGVKTLLTLHPQEANFQAFADRCRKEQPHGTAMAGSSSTGEIRPPDRSSMSSGSNGRTAAPPSPSFVPRMPQRLAVPQNAQLTMTVKDALDLNAANAKQLVHASLTQPMKVAAQADGAVSAGVLTLAAGTEVFLRCSVVHSSMNRLYVSLELDHALINGMSVPLRSVPQTHVMNLGPSAPQQSVNLGGFGRVRIPSRDAGANPTIVTTNEQLTFNTSQTTYAPAGFKP